MKSDNDLISNSKIYLFCNILILIGTLGLLPIYSKFLSPSDWGVVGIFLLFGQTLLGIISFGVPRASYYFKFKVSKEEFNNLQSTNFYFMVMIFIVTGFGVFYFAEIISIYLFNKNVNSEIIILSYFSGLFYTLSLYIENILTAQGRAIHYIIIAIFRFLFGSIIALILIHSFSFTYMSRVLGITFANIICLIISVFLLRKNFVFKFSTKSLKKSIKFSIPELPLGLIGLFVSSFDKVYLTNIKGIESLGLFNFGSRFVDIARQLPNSIRQSWNVFYFESVNSNKKNWEEDLSKKFEQILFMTSFPCLLLIIFSEELIIILSNNKEYLASMFVIPIYAFTYLISITDFISSNQITSSEKLIYQLPATIMNAISIIFLNILLVPKFGFLGLALAASLSFAISHLVNILFAQKVFYLRIKFIKIILFYFFTFLISLASYFSMNIEINFVFKVIIKILISFIVLVITLAMSGIKAYQIKLIFQK